MSWAGAERLRARPDAGFLVMSPTTQVRLAQQKF
jgi:hypothetical protein